MTFLLQDEIALLSRGAHGVALALQADLLRFEMRFPSKLSLPAGRRGSRNLFLRVF